MSIFGYPKVYSFCNLEYKIYIQEGFYTDNLKKIIENYLLNVTREQLPELLELPKSTINALLKKYNLRCPRKKKKNHPSRIKNCFRNFIDNNETMITNLHLKNKILKTTKILKTKVRYGQAFFRSNLLKIYKKCVVCSLDIKDLLKASHSKSWKHSNDKERLDFYNGLLLCSCHDDLYDKGYISFDDDRKIIISPLLDKNTLKLLNINKNIKITPFNESLKYLKWHREKIFRTTYKDT